MSVLDEIRAAEEKAAQVKENAKAECAEALRASEFEARREAAKLVADAHQKAKQISADAQTAYEAAEKKFAAELKDEKDRLTVLATANRKETADFAISLL